MSAIDTLCFDDFDPVPTPSGPTIDGFFLHDLGLENPAQVEMGYTRGCRYTWSGGGEPLAIFQGVKAGSFLIFGFFTRFDQRFNNNDKIIIALKPANNSPVTQQRRIDIAPVFLDLGAGTAPVGAEPDIRTNQPAQLVTVYKGFSDPADPLARWTNCAQTIDVKVRSWRPPSPASDVGWSVEVKVPMTPGADWITLADDFRLFFSMIRNIDAAGSTFYAGLQFPRDRAKLTGADGTTLDIPASSYGVGRIGVGLGQGVRFKDDHYGIGRLVTPSASPSTSSAITHAMSQSFNKVVGRIENTSPTDTATDVVAEFRFGRYGLPPGGGPASWFEWTQPAGMQPIGVTPKRTAPITLAPGTFGDLLTDWTLTPAEHTDFSTNTHRCMVTSLFSNTDVNFTQASVRANTDFVVASEVEGEAEVSGRGYPPPADGSGELEFLLFTYARALRGPALLDVYDIENSGDRTAAIARQLLAEVIPPANPEDAPGLKSDSLYIEPGELRWYAGDESPKSVRFTGGERGRRLQLRVLPPSPLDGFEWEGRDVSLADGKGIEVDVTPRGSTESRRTARVYYQLYGLDERGKPAALQNGAVLLIQDGATAPKPGTHWKEALSGSQVIVWTTFGFLRTGKFFEINGVKGEVLDETPGEFSAVALHQGVDDYFSWQLSGPKLAWQAPGVNRLKVPFGGVTHLDYTLKAGKEDEVGDRGPRYVQADPLELEWSADDAKAKSVTFSVGRDARFELELEVPAPPGQGDNDFVWKSVSTGIRKARPVRVEVTPPQPAASVDRLGELRYRVIAHQGGERTLESGRVRLIRRGASVRLPMGCWGLFAWLWKRLGGG